MIVSEPDLAPVCNCKLPYVGSRPNIVIPLGTIFRCEKCGKYYKLKSRVEVGSHPWSRVVVNYWNPMWFQKRARRKYGKTAGIDVWPEQLPLLPPAGMSGVSKPKPIEVKVT